MGDKYKKEALLPNECLNCPNMSNNTCKVYYDPFAFLRGTGQFMCPIKGYATQTEKKTKGKVRVGQQKQKGRK